MAPRPGAVRLPKLRQSAPGEDEGVLQCVLGEARVAQDPVGDRVERVADLVHQDGERLSIPSTGLLDQVSIHLGLRSSRPEWPRLLPLTEAQRPNVQMIGPGARARVAAGPWAGGPYPRGSGRGRRPRARPRA